jgi:NADH:ubiquinone oxidoreductase subunit 6 (subunit J)
MSADMLLLSALAGIAVVFALGVLLSKDNFYSALFMAATLVFVATVYAFFNLQPVFVLILFIFVGAIGIVTVALAATYRSDPERQVSELWAVPVFITALVIGSSVYSQIVFNPQPISSSAVEFELMSFIPLPEYMLIVVFLISLVVLLLLSVLKMSVGGRS